MLKKQNKYTIEYMVQMNCGTCVKQLENILGNSSSVISFTINLENQQVSVETSDSIKDITSLLEQSKKSVVLRGITTSSSKMMEQDYGSGVCIFINHLNVVGVCRIYQMTDDDLYFNGLVDGLEQNKNYRIFVHEFGDISNGPDSCGDVYGLKLDKDSEPSGYLGDVTSGDSGQCDINLSSRVIKLWDLIGRSMVIHLVNTNKRIFCGIIARSSGAFQNEKRVCACDGLTVWQEKENLSKL